MASLQDILGSVLMAGATGDPTAYWRMKEGQMEHGERQKDRELSRESMRLTNRYNQMRMEAAKEEEESLKKPLWSTPSLKTETGKEPTGYMDQGITPQTPVQVPTETSGPTGKQLQQFSKMGIKYPPPAQFWEKAGLPVPDEKAGKQIPIRPGGFIYDTGTGKFTPAPKPEGKIVKKSERFQSGDEWMIMQEFDDGTIWTGPLKPGENMPGAPPAATSAPSVPNQVTPQATPAPVVPGEIKETDLPPISPFAAVPSMPAGKAPALAPTPPAGPAMAPAQPKTKEPESKGLPAPAKKGTDKIITVKSFDKKTGDTYQEKKIWDGKELKAIPGSRSLTGTKGGMTEEKARKELSRVARDRASVETIKVNLKTKGVTPADVEKIDDPITRGLVVSMAGYKLSGEDFRKAEAVLNEAIAALDAESGYLKKKYFPSEKPPIESLRKGGASYHKTYESEKD